MKSRPVSHRDMTLRSPREILTHLAFVAWALTLPAGTAALVVGATRPSPTALVLGSAAVLGFGLLHRFARRPLGFAALLEELRRNPFKPARKPVPETASPAERCAIDGCGL